MNYTNNQLKQVLAKLLPDVLYLYGDEQNLCWICRDLTNKVDHYLSVDDTELLHICWLIEETLSSKEILEYRKKLISVCDADGIGFTFHATWQQRVIALAKVKSIN
jgi:hypothetical protein